MKVKVLFLASAGALAVAMPARAQSTNCPPGSWFCGSAGAGASTQAAPAASATATLQPLPPPQTQPPPPPPTVYVQPAQPPPTPYVAPPPRAAAPPPNYVTIPERPRWRPEWGFTGRLTSGLVGTSRRYGGGSGLVGLGLGVRYRPSAYFAAQASIDGFGGRDYYGRTRGEGVFGLDGIVFLNPQSRSQFYIIGGIGWASASVEANCGSVYSTQSNYRGECQPGGNFKYFGGQIGFGNEYRFSKHWAINADLRAFVRQRVDSDADRLPEFISSDPAYDSNGRVIPGVTRATNTSGGALLSVGAVLYF